MNLQEIIPEHLSTVMKYSKCELNCKQSISGYILATYWEVKKKIDFRLLYNLYI